MNLCYTIDKYGVLNDKKTFKRYHNTERLLETYKLFKIKIGQPVNGEIPRPWKNILLLE